MSLPVFFALLLVGPTVDRTDATPPAVASSHDIKLSDGPTAAAAGDGVAGSEGGAPAAVQPLMTAASQAAPGESEPSADIVVTARTRHAPGDPLERVNAKTFAISQDVDRAVVGPVATAYERDIPTPVRSGLRNFLNNLQEPDVFINFLVQLHPGKAAETFGRFAINSTIGVAGLIDVAKRHPFNLPRRRNGFADSMGYYGVKPGPFLFLPLIGATTVRDAIGGGLDRLVLPLAVGAPFNQIAFSIPAGAISGLDHRIDFDAQLERIRDGSVNPYAARRELYLKQRQAEIDGLHGRHRGVGTP